MWLILSACIGSFLSVLAHRLPKMLDEEADGLEPTMTLSKPVSSCPNCGVPIKWYHNIPFLGFLLVHRGTPCCGQKLSVRYLWLEAVATAWGLLVWWQFNGDPLALWAWGLFGWTLLVAAVVDAKSQWLPDVFTLTLLWAGLVFSALGGEGEPLSYRVLAAAGVHLAMRGLAEAFKALRGIEGIGGGDLKLLAALAVWLPLTSVAHALLLSCALQAVWMLAAKSQKAAFGPSICLSGALVAVWLW